jgi:HD-GYP domain-containing protein (c-di-GMP phosphodiesterase class II)
VLDVTLQHCLHALATFGRTTQPAWFAHIHPHGHATAAIARRFAAACTLSRGGLTLDEIEFGAHVHDIGKYLVSRAILFKPGPFTPPERAAMALHPGYGAQLLAGLPCVTTAVLQIVRYHHEHWDGTGYPEGLTGRAIPFGARLVAIADAYAALRAKRTYKPTYSRTEACAELMRMAGRELDPELTCAFVQLAAGKAPRAVSNGDCG